jgi:SAM-dependent methyltransferase
MQENIDKFIDELRSSLKQETFIKLTLGNYKGPDERLQKIHCRLVETKKGMRLFFLYRSENRDTAKNYSFDEGVQLIRKMLGTDFFAAHLFTVEHDFQLDIGKKGSRLNVAKPTLKKQTTLSHDRKKERPVDQNAFYLKALGITDDEGRVRDRAHDKWRQINRYVEILGSVIDKSPLQNSKTIRFVDMGSGKGYLTFATYDYFRNVRGLDISVTGVEMRADLVDRCNEIATASDYDGLRFVQGGIADADISGVDVLIALHACNTATDDALFKGIAADATVIVAAPCCHQELRPQIKPPEMLRDVLKHGIMLERTAEFVTDALRSLLLERSGYSVKLLDFVPVEHTPKNLMIIGTRDPAFDRFAEIDREIAELIEFYSIKEQKLNTLLAERKSSAFPEDTL